jgi:hypothetical protein
MTDSHVARADAGVIWRRRSRPTPAGDGGADDAPAVPSRTARAVGLLRRNWLVGILLVAGLVLRALALAAYRPALIYVDTLKYLYGASPGSDPLGYKVVLKAVLLAGNLTAVAAVQHLAGLAMAVVLYAVLVRRDVPRWLAALAAAPLLLDAYQLQMEQTIMPDIWFEGVIVAGLAVLLWSRRLSYPVVVAGGFILGCSATFKALGELLFVPAALFVLLAAGPWRRALVKAIALVIAFAVPILLYCGVNDARTGHFWLARKQTMTGRLAGAADCATLKLPANVRLICPPPAARAQGPDFLEHSGQSPIYSTALPAGVKRGRLITELNHAVVHQQPVRVATAILRDSVRLFALTRDQTPGVTPISRWQFQDFYPTYPKWVTLGPGHAIVVGVQPVAFGPFHFSVLKPGYGGRAQVNGPLARFLHAYQVDGGYTPGPLLALCVLLGLAGSVLIFRRRRKTTSETKVPYGSDDGDSGRDTTAACLLFTVAAIVVLLPPDVYEFSWRYQLPAVVTLVPAGALGLAALLALRRPRPAAAPPAAAAEPAPES